MKRSGVLVLNNRRFLCCHSLVIYCNGSEQCKISRGTTRRRLLLLGGSRHVEQNVAKDFKALTGGGSRSARGGASTRPLLGCCRDASPGPAGARAAEASCRKLRHSDGICHTVIASQVMNSFPPTVMWNAVTGRMPPDRLGTREADATGNASTAPPSAAAVAAAAAAAHHAPLPAPHAGAGAHVEEGDGRRAEESKEESILAALGIVGTVLNLLVIVFVYIYTAT
ncbi:protein TUNAR isoform X2 [Lampetra fluviatilis]